MPTLKLTKKYSIYPEYKDSGVEWLGKIPKGWMKNKIKFIAHVKPGFAFSSEDYDQEGCMLVRITDVKDKIDEGSKKYLPLSFYQKYLDFRVIKNDLLISMTWYVWETALFSLSEPALLNQRVGKITAKNVNSRFLYYSTKHQYFKTFLSFESKSSAQENVSDKDIWRYSLLLPNSDEQQRIADYLDQKTALIDQIIEKKLRQIELLREKRTAVINQAVTKGLDPDVELVESGIEWIGKIPSGWRIEKIKRISEMNKKSLGENTDPNFSFKYFDIGSVDEEETANIDSEITFEKAPSRARRIVSPWDTIIATVRTYLKAIAYFEALECNTIASTGFAVLTPNKKIEPKYLFYYTQSDRFINQVIIRSKGISYPAITPFDLGSLEMIYPDQNIQREIINYLDVFVQGTNEAIQKIEKSIELLKEFKSSLISHVVTGKIKI